MTASNRSHELLWLSCAAKRCCSLRTVRPTGGDIRRIATQLQIAPASFLRSVPAPSSADDGILLAPDAQPVHVALARRAITQRQATCVFLMHLRDDVAHCGLGDLRPLPCQAFPATGTNGVVRVTGHTRCTCRAWSIADLDRPAITALLAREAAERDQDRRLIGSWNDQVQHGAWSASLSAFCDYLIHAHSNDSGEAAGQGAL